MAERVLRVKSPGATRVAVPVGILSAAIGACGLISNFAVPLIWVLNAVAAAFLLLGATLLTRAWRLEVRIDSHSIVIRRWFGELTIPRGEVSAVEIGLYDGNLPYSVLWTHLEGSLGQLIVIDGDGRESPFPEIFGFSGQMRRVIRILRDALELSAPKHPRAGRGDIF